MAKQERPRVTVEMAPSGHVMMRFAEAVASSRDEPTMNGGFCLLEGGILVSVKNIEVAKTLRDSLSALLAFHQGCKQQGRPTDGQGTFSDERTK